MDIGVVGLGLIGGSMAKTIRRSTPHTVLGTDTDPQVMYRPGCWRPSTAI